MYRDATEVEAGGQNLAADPSFNMYRVEPPSDCCQFFKTCLEPDVVYRCSKNFIRLGVAACLRVGPYPRVGRGRFHVLKLKSNKAPSNLASNLNVRPLQLGRASSSTLPPTEECPK